MKVILLFTSAIALLFPASAGAKDKAQDQAVVVVARPVTLASWSQSVTKGIERHLIYPTGSLSELDPVGIVGVSFVCSESGRPTSVTLYRKSGSRALDGAALRAVNRIASLHPMPDRFRPNTRFVANILFATDEETYRRQLTTMQAEAAAHNARYVGPDEPVALIISSRATAGS